MKRFVYSVAELNMELLLFVTSICNLLSLLAYFCQKLLPYILVVDVDYVRYT